VIAGINQKLAWSKFGKILRRDENWGKFGLPVTHGRKEIGIGKGINICCQQFSMLGMNFKPIKLKCMLVGPTEGIHPLNMKINEVEMQWVEKIKYLGLVFTSGKSLSIDN